MAYEQKPNTGVLFKNTNKKADNHPDYQGKCLVNGTNMDIAAWINTSKSKGTKYMQLQFREPNPEYADKPLPNNQPADAEAVPF